MTKARKREWLFAGSLIVASLAVIWFSFPKPGDSSRLVPDIPHPERPLPDAIQEHPQLVGGELTGYDEAEIFAKYGPPHKSHKGTNIPYPPKDAHRYGNVMTYAYRGKVGYLEFSCCDGPGRRICYYSCWIPNNIIF